MATELLSPVLTGIKNINYFEGRLLTARDLSEQEEANRTLRWSMGKAIGTGIGFATLPVTAYCAMC